MEDNRYISQLNTDLNYYVCIHRRRPEKIFISHHLWSTLFTEDYCPVFYNMGETPTYNGIPVQVFISGNLEYYFVSSGYIFEAEE